jgi:hypothetical protein
MKITSKAQPALFKYPWKYKHVVFLKFYLLFIYYKLVTFLDDGIWKSIIGLS